MYVGVWHSMWKSEDNLQESVLCEFWSGTQVIRLGSKPLYLVSHLAGPDLSAPGWQELSAGTGSQPCQGWGVLFPAMEPGGGKGNSQRKLEAEIEEEQFQGWHLSGTALQKVFLRVAPFPPPLPHFIFIYNDGVSSLAQEDALISVLITDFFALLD